ncbi:hypothetical protein [Azotobacter vinelandii]|uniref:hypothetical protein n=1 Tax=Azotobacter vinelandii TaxID=354 RepID=UPI0030D0D95E
MSWDEIGPKVQAGKLVPFESYLSQTRAIREAPSLWKDASITNACLADSGTARGALSIKNSEREQAGEIASGVSMVLQLIKPLDSTTPHSHSFWHIYIVIGGG